MNNRFVTLLFLFILFSSCSNRISTRIFNLGQRMNQYDPVIYLDINEPLPTGSIVLGKVKVKDIGLGLDGCDFTKVKIDAKNESRHIGGNVIKVVKDKTRIVNDKVCHNIEAKILLVKDSQFLKAHEIIDTSLVGKGYALLHFYRPSGAGFVINYNIHDDENVLVRTKDNWKTTIRYRKAGEIVFWAATEYRNKMKINIELEKQYYIKCGITMGLVVGHPSFKRVNNELGKYEFDRIVNDYYEKYDYILLNDGRKIMCKILEEDDDMIKIKYYEKNKKKRVLVQKKDVIKIERGI